MSSQGSGKETAPSKEIDIVEQLAAAMKKDGDFEKERIDRAFKVLSKGEAQITAPVSADVFRCVMENLDVKLTTDEVAEKLNKEKPNWNAERINFSDFYSMIRSLKGLTVVVGQLTKIYEILNREEAEKLVLYGPAGVGKTWMARKIADRAVREKKFDVALWMYPERSYEGADLQESIASQLSILWTFYESEVNEEKKEKEKGKSKMEKEKQESPEEMQKNREGELEKKIHEELKEKNLLLIYDYGSADKQKDDPPVKDLERVLGPGKKPRKVLVTIRSEEPSSPEVAGVEVMPWTWEESRAMVGVGEADSKAKDLADFFICNTKRLPAEVLIIRKTMSHFKKRESSGSSNMQETKEFLEEKEEEAQKLQKIKELLEKEKEEEAQKMQKIKELLENGKEEEAKKEEASVKWEREYSKVIQLLIKGYDPIPRSILIDCYSSVTHPTHFLRKSKRGMANFNELISYWILEGHLGHFDCIEDAHEKGYRVVMDLLDCGLLRKLEDNYVMSSGWEFDFDILDYYSYSKGVQLGMGATFDSKLGRIAFGDGMMRTMKHGQVGNKLLTLLLDGSHFEAPDSSIFEVPLFEDGTEGFWDPQLEILAIINPTRKPFPVPIYKMENLRLLVLRGCRYMKEFKDFFRWSESDEDTKVVDRSPPNGPQYRRTPSMPSSLHHPSQHPDPDLQRSQPSSSHHISFQKLTVFEISGPYSFKKFPDYFTFRSMPHLRSVNMSFLNIEYLPNSFYNLEKVEFLILRGCSKLKMLKSLENFAELELLDLSGSTSLEIFEEKNFAKNKKLQIINFSQTKIERIPLVHSLPNLKSVTLCDCKELLRIRKFDRVKTLQVLNISGATKVEKFLDPTLEHFDSLVVLDVSRTGIRQLPASVANPRYLYLRDCLQLKELPPVVRLSKVEVLDLSGSCNLEEIRMGFLENMTCLRELNLSKTGIKNCPSLPSPLTLRQLLLSQCKSLEKLEMLSSLENLEVLDLSGCESLMMLEEKPFVKMKHLHSLHLSGLQLDQLPSLSGLMKLENLYVRDCPKITDLPGIGGCHKLKILDHFGTTLKSRPSINSGCHPTGPVAPGGELPKDSGADEKPIVDLDQCNWNIFSWPEGTHVDPEKLGEPEHGIHFLQRKNKHPLLFKRFHLSVFPAGAQPWQDKSSYRDDFIIRDCHFKEASGNELQRFLEIRGFTGFPPSVQHLLPEAELVLLIDNPFIRSLFSLRDGTRALKACWIERCNEMEYVVCSEKVEDADKAGESTSDTSDPGNSFAEDLKNLEILWVSDVLKLRSISSGDIQGFSFKSLNFLYLEFCPEISTICSSFSQLESLRTLHIRYCQKLKALFKDKPARLEKLTAVHLWGLPKLQTIECEVPSLQTFRVGDCCNLEHVISSSQRHEKLDTLQIKFCDKLKTICGSPDGDVSASFPNLSKLELWALPGLQKFASSAPKLQVLRVGECHSMETIIDSKELPQKLEILEVKSCDKLKMIVRGDASKWGQNIVKIDLMCLPELENLGTRHFPSLQEGNRRIWGCPNLENSTSIKASGEASDTPESNDGTNP